MLELLCLYLLCSAIGRRAVERDRSPLGYQVTAVILYLVGILVGGVVGLINEHGTDLTEPPPLTAITYLYCLGGGISGGALGYALIVAQPPANKEVRRTLSGTAVFVGFFGYLFLKALTKTAYVFLSSLFRSAMGSTTEETLQFLSTPTSWAISSVLFAAASYLAGYLVGRIGKGAAVGSAVCVAAATAFMASFHLFYMGEYGPRIIMVGVASVLLSFVTCVWGGIRAKRAWEKGLQEPPNKQLAADPEQPRSI